MKRFLYYCIIFPFSLLFAACGLADFSVTVKNESSVEVFYTYNGVEEALPSGATKVSVVKAYTPAPSAVSCGQAMPLSVFLEADANEYFFRDAPFFNLSVENKTAFDLTLTAGNYINNGGSISLSVDANSSEEGAKIYARKAKFTTSPYSVKITQRFEDETLTVILGE